MIGSRTSTATLLRLFAALVAAVLLVSLPSLSGLPAAATESTTPESPTPTPTSTSEPAATAAATSTTAPATTATATTATATTATATTATATTAPTVRRGTLGWRTLRYGHRGADVRALQRLLDMSVTGYFGPVTRRNVKAAQREAHLRATGVVNARTLAAIRKQAAASDREAASSISSRGLPRAGAPAASKRYARAYIARKYGWGSAQMSCLASLWTRESGWRYWVSNPNGIYRGIPQTSARVWGAMGYTTRQYMRSPEIQIKVGTRYIKGRYGTPCKAWAFWRSHHWY